MVKNQLTYSQAKDLAIGRGLGVEDSEKLAELVKTINQEFATGKTSKTYLDYLREQEEKNKEK